MIEVCGTKCCDVSCLELWRRRKRPRPRLPQVPGQLPHRASARRGHLIKPMRLGSGTGRNRRAESYTVDNPLVSLTNLQKHQAQLLTRRADGIGTSTTSHSLKSVSPSLMPYPHSSSSSSLIAKCGTTITCVLRSVPLWVVVIVVLLFGFARRRVSRLFGTYKPSPPHKE